MVWFSPGGGGTAYSLKLASINTFLVNSPIAARYRGPQLSSDVTHHSGVFTAYYVRKRGFSWDRLPRFVTHVLSFRKKKKKIILSGSSSAQMCHRWRPFQTCSFTNTNTREGRQRCRVRQCSCMCEPERLEVSWRHQLGSFISHRTINYIPPLLPYEFVALVQRLHSQLGRKDGYLLSYCRRDERVPPQLTQHAAFHSIEPGLCLLLELCITNVISAGISILYFYFFTKLHQIWCKMKNQQKSTSCLSLHHKLNTIWLYLLLRITPHMDTTLTSLGMVRINTCRKQTGCLFRTVYFSAMATSQTWWYRVWAKCEVAWDSA